MNLDEKLVVQEKYALPRDEFPIEFNGHELHLIHNDGFVKQEEPYILIDIGLHCTRCNKPWDIHGLVDVRNKDTVTLIYRLALGGYTDSC